MKRIKIGLLSGMLGCWLIGAGTLLAQPPPPNAGPTYADWESQPFGRMKWKEGFSKKPGEARDLRGAVLGKKGNPAPGATVYLKDVETGEVLPLNATPNGRFMFEGLSKMRDYKVWAEWKGNKTNTVTLSMFNQNQQPFFELKLPVPVSATPSGDAPKQ